MKILLNKDNLEKIKELLKDIDKDIIVSWVSGRVFFWKRLKDKKQEEKIPMIWIKIGVEVDVKNLVDKIKEKYENLECLLNK